MDILNIKIYRNKLNLELFEKLKDKAIFDYLHSEKDVHTNGEAIDKINRLISLVNDLKQHS